MELAPIERFDVGVIDFGWLNFEYIKNTIHIAVFVLQIIIQKTEKTGYKEGRKT